MKLWPEEHELRKALDTSSGAGVKVAILDSGVSLGHPMLSDLQLEDSVCFEALGSRIEAQEGAGDDVNGHGTAVAYLVRKIAPEARIGSFRVLDQNIGSTRHKIAAGVRAALERGYHVLNCSFGHKDLQGNAIMSYKSWVDDAYLRKVSIVSACNNDSAEIQEWPGFFPTCINVNLCAKPDPHFHLRPGSLAEFEAPGVNVEVPWLNGGTKVLTGSSFAAPIVAGFVARLLAVFPHLSVPQVKGILHHFGGKPFISGTSDSPAFSN